MAVFPIPDRGERKRIACQAASMELRHRSNLDSESVRDASGRDLYPSKLSGIRLVLHTDRWRTEDNLVHPRSLNHGFPYPIWCLFAVRQMGTPRCFSKNTPLTERAIALPRRSTTSTFRRKRQGEIGKPLIGLRRLSLSHYSVSGIERVSMAVYQSDRKVVMRWTHPSWWRSSRAC